jgi:polyisoprenoid-binding protein YceI
MKKGLTGLVVIVLIILAFTMFKADDKNTLPEQEVELFAGSYEVEAGTLVEWEGKKPLLDNYLDSGTLAFKSGDFVVDAEGNLTGTFVLDMETIMGLKTGNGEESEGLTNHLKSADWFDVENFPEATFVITGFEKVDDMNTFLITGDLTMRDLTNEVVFESSLLNDDNSLRIVGEAIVDRSAYGIEFNSGSFFEDLGNNLIADEMTIRFDITALGELDEVAQEEEENEEEVETEMPVGDSDVDEIIVEVDGDGGVEIEVEL